MRTKRRFLLVGALLVLILALGGVLLAQLIQRQQSEQVRESTLLLSHQLLINVEMFFGEHARMLSLVRGIYADGRIRSQEDFSIYGRQIFSVLPGLHGISFASADYKILYHYPNPEKQVPHDLRIYPDRYAFAEKARTTGRLTVTDPVHFAPSGELGLGVYLPVFNGAHFEGLVIGLIDIVQLVDRQLKPAFRGVPFTISTNTGRVFYSSGAPMGSFKNELVLPVRLADNIWMIRTPGPQLSPGTLGFSREVLLVALVLIVATCLSLLYLFQANQLEIQRQALHIFEANYREVCGKFDAKFDKNANLYDQLERVQRNLVEATRLATLGELSTAIAHEIRNPLSALVNCISVLERSVQRGGEDAELLRICMQEALRLNQIVSGFLTFARPKRLSLQKVNVASLLDDVGLAFRGDPRWKDKVTIARNCLPPCPTVDADPDQIRQVFWNLLLNAAQAIATTGEIHTSCIVADGTALIRIRDDGQGIPADLQDRVFEPFFSTKASGMGLGLPIVKKIVDDHGGSIILESEPGAGTCVQVTLPLRIEGGS